MKYFLIFITFMFIACSSLITGVVSATSSIVVFAITLPIKAVYKISKSTLDYASSSSNSSLSKKGEKALKKQNYKKAYEYYKQACNEDEISFCALAKYSYKKCELLNDGCKYEELPSNNAINYLTGKLFLDEAKALSGDEKQAYIKIACEFDNSLCE